MTAFAPNAMTSLIDTPIRYDLSESTCPSLRLGDLINPADLADLPLDYGTSRGDIELRSLIAAETGVTAEQVLVTHGAIEALFLLAQAHCAPGDHVVVVTPYFPSTWIVPEGLGARVDELRLSFDEGYRLPLDRLARLLTPATRLVSLASPQNPSGVRFTDDELAALLDLVRDRAPRAVVMVDESYRESTYGDAAVPPSAAGLPRVVTCASLSKCHDTPGLRVGWLTTTDPELYEQLRNAKFVSTIACSTVDELLAAQVLRKRADILGARAARLGRLLARLEDWVSGQPVEWIRPDGGALCCLRLPADCDIPTFYGKLAERDTRVVPGSWFGEYDRVFRVGFGYLSEDDFAEALRRLGEALST